jgi:hypothetical protein
MENIIELRGKSYVLKTVDDFDDLLVEHGKLAAIKVEDFLLEVPLRSPKEGVEKKLGLEMTGVTEMAPDHWYLACIERDGKVYVYPVPDMVNRLIHLANVSPPGTEEQN